MYRDRRAGVVVPAYHEELLPGETPGSIPDAVDGIAAVNGCSHGLTEQQTVLAAIPAYNTERSIAGTVLRVRQYVDQVLVVDGSVDATGAIATALGARVVRHAGNGMSADPEIFVQAAGAGLTIAEVPITVRSEIEGAPDEHPAGQGIPVFMQIIRSTSCCRPLFFFGIPGLLFTILGAGAELYTFSEYLLTARFHYIIFTMGAALLMMGLLLVTAGMILYPLARIIQGQESRTGAAAEPAAPPRPVPSPRTRVSDPRNLATEVQQ